LYISHHRSFIRRQSMTLNTTWLYESLFLVLTHNSDIR
jgi:hypothetical protein